MSEYQYVGFRAIDRPVSEKNLQFMEKQSSRAEITPWTFDNEYHWGNFRGDPEEMLRRGYDVHLHYANFGIRKLMFRLPNGWADAAAAEPYLGEEGLEFLPDKSGSGGILLIDPAHEAGSLDDLWEIEGFIDQLAGLRSELLAGDLRPLYLAHLAICLDMNHDPDTIEGPVPAGLEKLTGPQQALAQLYGMSGNLIAATAQGAPRLPEVRDLERDYAAWLAQRDQSTKDRWLAQWMGDPHSSARREIMAAYQAECSTPLWPTIRLERTISALESAADTIARQTELRQAATAARARAKRLAAIAADPLPTLQETEALVAKRSSHSYAQIAQDLADVREALAHTADAEIADTQARKLKQKHPTLRLLISELKKQGFLAK